MTPSGADLSFVANEAIGNLLLYFCCYCGESVKKGVSELVERIVESAPVKVMETIYPHANFLLALQKGCSFYTKEMCQRDMIALIEKRKYGDGGWNGRVSPGDLRALVEKYVENSKSLWGSDWESAGGLMTFVLGYLGKMTESYRVSIAGKVFLSFFDFLFFFSFLFFSFLFFSFLFFSFLLFSFFWNIPFAICHSLHQ